LLGAGDFNKEAKSYIARCGETINVEALFADYSARVYKFYEWLKDRLEAQLPAELSDYRRCVSAHKAYMARMTWRLILRHSIDNGADPYEHLDKYLEREALDEIERLPLRSGTQVNRIIELIDEHGACNDELRELAYCLFK
jgi:hypothetical protein